LAIFSTTRRRFLLGAVAAGATALGADGVLLEPNFPRLVRKEFSLPRWPEQLDGFTIALLSDFHYDPIFSVHPLHGAVPMVNRAHPDLVALVGDFVTIPSFGEHKKGALAAEPCAQLLSKLTAPHGLWAVLGNHDDETDPEHVSNALTAQNIKVLANQSVPIERDGAHFWLAGVNDVLSHTADMPKTLQPVPSDEAVVLLAHEPDYADEVQQYPVDLQLSGHSHGGQIRIPFVPLFYLPKLGRKYVWGTYQIGPLPLYTTAGLGTIELPIRFRCPPEVVLVTLRKSKK
jgi:uncharacterized protein